jgi:hypothetical protein
LLIFRLVGIVVGLLAVLVSKDETGTGAEVGDFVVAHGKPEDDEGVTGVGGAMPLDKVGCALAAGRGRCAR